MGRRRRDTSHFSSGCSDLSHSPVGCLHRWYDELLLIGVARSHRAALEECLLYIPVPDNPGVCLTPIVHDPVSLMCVLVAPYLRVCPRISGGRWRSYWTQQSYYVLFKGKGCVALTISQNTHLPMYMNWKLL